MTATTYQHCYQLLRVSSDCDWNALRLAYRRRVHLCHPDRMPPGTAMQPGRDDEFKQVVRAYRLLARFRVRHGELPPPWLVVNDNIAVVVAPSRKPSSKRREKREKNKVPAEPRAFPWLPPFHRALIAAFVCGVSTAALLEQPGHGKETPDASGDGKLAVGMDAQSVVDVQGVPSYTRGSVWFYGDSGVIFDRGCVVGWENQPPFPLRTLVGMTYLPGQFQARRESRTHCTGPVE